MRQTDLTLEIALESTRLLSVKPARRINLRPGCLGRARAALPCSREPKPAWALGRPQAHPQACRRSAGVRSGRRSKRCCGSRPACRDTGNRCEADVAASAMQRKRSSGGSPPIGCCRPRADAGERRLCMRQHTARLLVTTVAVGRRMSQLRRAAVLDDVLFRFHFSSAGVHDGHRRVRRRKVVTETPSDHYARSLSVPHRRLTSITSPAPACRCGQVSLPAPKSRRRQVGSQAPVADQWSSHSRTHNHKCRSHR